MQQRAEALEITRVPRIQQPPGKLFGLHRHRHLPSECEFFYGRYLTALV